MTFHKYTKLRHLGDKETHGLLTEKGKVVVQSKVDGANFSFFIDHESPHSINGLCFCKHSSILSIGEWQARKGDKSWVWKAVPDIIEAYEKNPDKFKNSLLYYCESMQRHTLTYPDNMPGCIGFDVFSLDTKEFLDWKIAKQEFELIGLPFIHVHMEKEACHITIDKLKALIPISPYRKDGDEGIVIKRYDIKNIYGRPLFGKIVADDFKEKNRQKFIGVKNVYTDELGVVNLYGTDARIEKIIHKLHDDGNDISMPMMRVLFKEVVKDILEEHILEIYENQKMVNFKILEKLIANRCQKVLRHIMEDQVT